MYMYKETSPEQGVRLSKPGKVNWRLHFSYISDSNKRSLRFFNLLQTGSMANDLEPAKSPEWALMQFRQKKKLFFIL